ncbi:MAG: recombinase family protein [Clostridiales bacterium]|nr:recombinase family protein [Clostridiales bacterium]
MGLKRAAIYVRVSTEAQREEGYSIGAQKEALEAYCVSRSIRPYEFYVDGGFSGSNLKRPAMERMVEDICRDEISHVLVYKLDRLSRSQKDTLHLIEDIFNPHQVTFISLNESMDTGTPMGRLMLGILSAFAQLERENIRERTRMGMQERVREGYWMGGGKIPFGYDYDRKKGILVPNKDAETVRNMYLWYLEGYSPQNIADMTGLRYDRQVVQILNRRTNLGVICYNGKEYPGRHEPIVEPELFDAVALEMERRSDKNQHMAVHLLTGLLRCGYCGAGMRYQKWGKKGHKLVCYSHQKTKAYLIKDPECPQEPVWSFEIEEAVIRDLFHFRLEMEVNEGQASPSAEKELEERCRKVNRKLERLYQLYGEAEVSGEQDEALRKTIETARREREMAEKKLEMEKKRQSISMGRKQMEGKLHRLSDVWNDMSLLEKRMILLSCLEEVEVRGGQVTLRYRDFLSGNQKET